MLLLYDEEQRARCLGSHGLASCGLERDPSWSIVYRRHVGPRAVAGLNFARQGKATGRFGVKKSGVGL